MTQISTKILEDNTTLLQIEHPLTSREVLYASKGVLVSYFAIQPVHDLDNAARNLFRVTSQPGVQILRQTFTALPRKSKAYSKRDVSYTGLSLIVRVFHHFHIRSESTLPIILRHIRKEFLKQRTLTYTILKVAGFEVSLAKGKRIFDLHFRGKKMKEGISIFPSQTGSKSKLLDRFFNLERVPSRFIQDFAVPDLPVIHRIGYRVDNTAIPVGFADLSAGSILVCGSDNSELITLFQNLTLSFSISKNNRGLFIIDTHNEFNGLIQHFRSSESNKQGINLQVFQLGTNMFINLCDVIIPPSPSGKKQKSEAIEAWKAHLVSNILLCSLSTSDYLTSRFAIPLEAQIRNAATGRSIFTLEDVTTTIGSSTSGELESEIGATDGIFADIMAIEHLNGILDQFKAFKEVNYPAFTGHLSNSLFRDDSITIFQFGAQPPMIKRATVAFLLQFLSMVARNGVVVFPHADEILSRKTPYGRNETGIPTVLIDSVNNLSRENVLVLGGQSVQALASKVNSFEQIKNQIYLRLVNTLDREIVITQHQLKVGNGVQSATIERQILGIMEGEGLLFRSDTSQSTAYHFKMDRAKVPINLNPVKVTETKLRGSKTFGLIPQKFALLMNLLKTLKAQPLNRDMLHDELEIESRDETLLEQMKQQDLYSEREIDAARQWEITVKGSEFYDNQVALMENLPAAPTTEEAESIEQKIAISERFFDRTASKQKLQEENVKIKNMVGELLNFLYQMQGSIPWVRYAQYTDLKEINGIEGQDFRQLYNLALEICSDIWLDIKNVRKIHKNDNVPSIPIIPSIPGNNSGNLDKFLPDDRYVSLQTFSKALGLKKYPDHGILDVHFKFLKQGKRLVEELNLE